MGESVEVRVPVMITKLLLARGVAANWENLILKTSQSQGSIGQVQLGLEDQEDLWDQEDQINQGIVERIQIFPMCLTSDFSKL